MRCSRSAIKAANQPGKKVFTVDGVHMNTEGNKIMATGVLQAFGLDAAQIKKAEEAWVPLEAQAAGRSEKGRRGQGEGRGGKSGRCEGRHQPGGEIGSAYLTMKVGLIGLGAIGRVHFDCWRKSPAAQLVAVSDRDPKKLAGEWAGKEFNIGAQAQENVRSQRSGDVSGAPRISIADPQVEIVDICMPTLVACAAGHRGFARGQTRFLRKADVAHRRRMRRDGGGGHALRAGN